ncbi:DNA/RNA polymerases superfamily protein [Gossypium australe]|uniref:DNA/RNA polymerases superfamily protein n=1 Tax=Gossypium australe TaxID=47621 RepID=A0A5B6TYR3_9ROSI|nr:DNA/RNA polymerases superfamily protein [Gossypium australe]
MLNLLTSESQAPGSVRFTTTYNDSGLTMRASYNGFCTRITINSKKKDVIWVVVDRLTKFVYFIPIRIDYSLERLAELYIYEIFEGNWDKYLPLAEFTYNNIYQSSIRMALLDALCGRKCRTLLYCSELCERKLIIDDKIRLDQIYMFYVSTLRHYRLDPSHVISLDKVELQPYLSYSEELVRIFAREV